MKRPPLLLEQLEERIFLDANPLVPGDLGGELEGDLLAAPLESAAETAAPEPEELQQQPAEESSTGEPVGDPDEGQVEPAAESTEQSETETQPADDGSSLVGDEQADVVGESTSDSPGEEVPAVGADSESDAEADQLAGGTDSAEETLVVPLSDDEAVAQEGVRQVVFIDSSLADHETLLDGIVADILADSAETDDTEEQEESSEQTSHGLQIVTLDSGGDQFQQISDTLAEYTDLEGVHILSHGSSSSLRLGETTLDSDNLDEYADQLSQWGDALGEDGDLLLYGCNVAEDGAGLEFIESVATLTGADVAASNDPTGNESSGGDWDLEVTTGDIDVEVLHDASGVWDGLLAPPDPLAGGSTTNAQPMLNSQIGFSVTFDNDADNDDANEGYGPYLDVVVPVAVDVLSDPTIFGNPATYQTFTWNGTAWEDGVGEELVEHPFDSGGVSLTIPTGTDSGDTWYLIEMPFGSFVREQPITSVDFSAEISTANGAVAGEPLEIVSRAGFRYGDTPTNDNGPIEQLATHTITITPQVIDIAKSDNAPEGQTVTGPNFPVEYSLTINIANGETVDNVVVSDYLPENAVYRGDVAITAINGATVLGAPVVTEPTSFTVLGSTPNDRLLEINLGSLTGVNHPASGTSEYVITYTVYFSDVDANGDPLLDPASGDDENVMNESTITGTYNGDPVSDGVDSVLGLLNDDSSDSITPSDDQIEIDSIVVYKEASNLHDGGTETVAGDVIEWRLEVDVSDYFGVGNVVLDDVFGDGQTFIDGVNAVHVDQLVPTLEVYENGVHTASVAFDAANYSVGVESALNAAGDTSLQFRVSDQLVSMGQDSYLDGGYFADGAVDGADDAGDPLNGRIGGDGTHVYIVYRTVVDQDYDKLHLTAGYSGDPSVDIGDSISNDVQVTADIVESVADRTVIGSEDDLSSASTSVPGGDVFKEIYAVNGDTGYDISQGVMSGDLVTYHLQMTVPTADFEQLHITDFLPLPAYDVLEVSANTGNDFDGIIGYSAGEIEFGPLHNLNSISIPGLQHNDSGVDVGATPIAPDLTVDTANNSLLLDFGNYDSADPAASGVDAVIDILITVTIQNNPMVDELMLTNQAEWTLNDTNLSPSDQADIVPIKLNEPVVNIVKGVVATDNSNSDLGVAQGPAELTFNADGTISVGGDGSVDAADLVDNPVDADLSNADGSDLVTFAITVYNTGGSDAFDIHVTDTLPTGFVAPADLAALNLNVYDGTGTLLTEGLANDYTVSGGDFFANGIDFHNTPLGGNSADRGHDGGQDVFIITYQLQVDNETVITPEVVNAGSSHLNEATVDFYTGADDGVTDWTERFGEPADTATVDIADPQVEKHLISTEIVDGTNANNEAVIGEEATYQVTITLPEGLTPDAKLVDTLDPGLTFLALTGAVSSSADLTSDLGVINTTNITASPAGQVVTFDLGNLTNTNADNTTAETITLTYTVLVNNSADNQSGVALDNLATVTFTGGQSNSVDSEDLTVIEPDLEVLKDVVVDGSGSTGDAGDPVEYTITIQHSGISETDAFDISFSDDIPSEIDGAAISGVTDSAGSLGAGDFTLDGSNHLSLNSSIDMPEGRVITITVTGTLADTVTPSQVITNSAAVQWQSLDAIHNQDGTGNERTGAGGVNDYEATGSAPLTVDSVVVDKVLIDTELSDDLQNPNLIDEPGVNERLEAVIGEEATYEVTISIPEGEMDVAKLVDTLDTGLAIQRIDSVTGTGGLSTDLGGGFGAVSYAVSGTGASGDPQTVTFDLGNLVNSDDNSGVETLTIRYTVLVLDDVANSDGDTVDNSAQVTWDSGSSNSDSAEAITIIEPIVSTEKIINGVPDPGAATVQVDDILTYTVTLTNTGTADAFEVTALDTLAPGTRYYTDGTHVATATVGGVTITDNTNGNGLDDGTIAISSSADGWDLAVGESVTITYYALVGADYFDNTYGITAANLTNTVDADWSGNDDTLSATASGLDRIYDDGATGPIHTVDGTQDEDPAVFALDYTASIGDMVFFDSLGDGGGFNSGEGDVGIDGVTVILTATVDGVTHSWTEVTGAGPGAVTGYYLFADLPVFDEYVVTVDFDGSQGGADLLDSHGYLPSYDLDGTGSAHVTSGVVLTAGQERTDVDFGYSGQNSVGDTVWFDVDGDGIQDGNEDGINGLAVTLTADIDGDGIYEYTATTTTQTIGGVDGQYLFEHLPGGDYQVTVAPPAGSEQTYDLDDGLAAADDRADFSLTGVEDNLDVDFGYRGTGSIADFVWFDANADALQNDGITSGLAGVDLILSGDFDGDSVVDYTVTTTTAADGSYLFDSLLGGTYTIAVDASTLPSGAANWLQTYDLDEGGAPAALDHTATDISLAAGEDRQDVDFGYTGTGSLGDTVWYDLDADGVQDAAELGLAGVEVTITADVDGDGIAEYTNTATTDGLGQYSFINLPAAAYTTTVNTATLPGGEEQTYDRDDGLAPFGTPDSDTSTLGIGEDLQLVDFGYRGTASLGDFIWYDADGDTIQDEGVASGLGGIRVTLSGDIDNDGIVDYTNETVTADDGSYLFDSLFAGDYTITVDDTTLAGGMEPTHDLDGIATAHVAAGIALAAGEARRDVDFGYTGTGSLGDTLFFDAAADGGVFDAGAGDVGISGVDVTLTADLDGDGVSEYTQTVRTDGDGNYLFTNLAAFADYVITVDAATSGGTNPTDLTASGYLPSYDLDGTGSAHVASGVVLTAGQERTDVDFGYSGQNSVGDTVWFDVDGDGIQDGNEDGINGLTVTLTADIDGDGIYEYTATTTTQTIGGVDGQYLFEHLPGGDYQVTVAPPAGSEQTYDLDDGLAAADDRADFSLTGVEDNLDVDFGYRGTGSIADFVWFDANADALQNDGITSGLAGVDLILSGDFDGDSVIDYTVTTTTAADGSYLFDSLLGGTFTIAVDASTLPSGAAEWVQTYDLDEGGAPAALDHTATDIVLAAGAVRDDVDFAYRGTGSLGDTVWYDLDADGVQDATELILAGVEVSITADVDGDNINNYTNSVITDANGNYLFANLPAGEYTISINTATLPDGAVPTYDLDSATTAPDNSTVYSLNSGENTKFVDFGYTGSGSIGDTVWDDSNGDGLQDPGEQGLAGVTVTLTGDLDNDGVVDDSFITVTAADGTYSFDHLFLGNYQVTVDATTLPPGSNQTHDLDDPAGTDPIMTPHQAEVLLTADDPVNNDVDFGYNSQGTIGDTIWYDADGDSLQDAGELGLAGVTVTLNGPSGTVTAVTDATGTYLFDQLPAGDYTISVSDLPDGMIQTADPDGTNDNSAVLTLGIGETNLEQDFGYTGTGSIGDTVWNDADGDGLLDAGEGGYSGVTVTLTGDLNNDGTLDTLSTSTDANGNYHFANLAADTYVVTVDETTLPPGVVSTYDLDGTGTEHSATVVLATGQTNNDLDFGYQQTGTLGDTIWYDADGDGLQDVDELGLAGVTVTLDGPSGTVTATTDGNGNYLFAQLAAGDYTITVSNLPAGMEQTYDPDGTATADSAEISLGDKEVNLDVDFGYTGTGTIGDTIWNDIDGDGVEDPGETGLSGISVTLSGDLNNDGTPDLLTTSTDADGHYAFDYLPEGDYTISVDETTLPPGMVQTGDPEGAMDNSAEVTLGGGNPMTTESVDFGYQQTGTIGDTVWYDMNGNGMQDQDELGLANINVTLVGDLDGDGLADDTRTVVTDGNGNYLFDHLPAGTYTLSVDPATLPQGMEQTYDLDGIVTADSAELLLGDNELNLGVDFGYTGTGSIGDTIWYDADGDGVEDVGETGLAGVSVTLIGDLDNDGQADDTVSVITAADGSYSFTNLAAGDYAIVVDPTTLPAGMIPSGDPDAAVDNTTALTLGAGESNNEQDFGYTGTGSIGDTVWYDSNGNGIVDGGESGVSGVEVTLAADFDGDGAVDYTAVMETDESGSYLFTHLPAGSYTISIDPTTLPGGLEQTVDPDELLNHETTLDLGPGEDNLDQDFAYAYPPVAPPLSIVSSTPSSGLPLAPDVLLMHQFSHSAVDDDETFLLPEPEMLFMPPPIPVSPVYTGHAEPGTTLSLVLYDAMGNSVGYQTVMADTGGNWLAGFAGTILYDMPHRMEISQTASLYNDSTPGLFNLRSYFNPAISGMVFSSICLDLQSITAYEAATVGDSVHSGHNALFNLGWNEFSGYEFFSPSTNPAQHKR